MAFLPLIERELRVALRKKRPVRDRLIVAAACSGGALLFLCVATMTGSRTAGRDLHKLFCLAGAYMALRTPLLMAGAFAEERRNQTLGLLFLSGMGAGEIFLSKLFSAVMIAFSGLLAMFPLLALPFLIGGVSFDLFLATIVTLPNLLVFALAVTLLASVLTQDDGAAIVLVGVLAALLCAVPAMVYWGQAHFAPGAEPSSAWLRLSPAYGPYLVWRGLSPARGGEFWRSFVVTLCWSLLCLLAANVALRRLWRQWQENREVTSWSGRWRQLLHGKAQGRQRLAARWLAANPYAWLAARDRQPTTLAWLVVGGLALVWGSCLVVWRGAWLSVPNFCLTATLLNLALRWMIHYTAAQGLGSCRRDGTCELLLTTPLSPSDIVAGQLEALRWQFVPVTRVVLVLNAGLMLAGLPLRRWTPGALYVYSVFWACLLLWALAQHRNWRAPLLVMWVSLNCGRPAHAVWRATGLKPWWWICMIFNSSVFGPLFSRFPSGSRLEILWASWMGFLFLAATLGNLISAGGPNQRERRLVSEFRDIVREPLPDPDDPRFKKWNFHERFPWGVFEQHATPRSNAMPESGLLQFLKAVERGVVKLKPEADPQAKV